MKPENNLSIFLVDDDKMFLKSLEHSVHHLFQNIKTKNFLTGEECLNHLSEQPDAIVLDYFLPGINGFNTYKQIKESLPRMPVILLSNSTDEKTIQQFITEGVYEYIIKTRHYIDGLKLSLGNILEKKSNNNIENAFCDYMLLFQDIGGES